MQVTILEGFGVNAGGFVCDACERERKYYDRLSNGNVECLECTTKAGYKMDGEGTYHQRSSDLMTEDPELLEITQNIIQWKLDTGTHREVTVRLSAEVVDQLEKMAEKTDSSVEVLINAGVSLMLNNYRE